MPGRLFIHATNVHQGGGRALLLPLLQALPRNIELMISLDTRMDQRNIIPNGAMVRWVKPTILKRLAAEWWLAKNVGTDDFVLCFGNLPPMFRLLGCVFVFVQNRYPIERVNLAGFPFKTRLKFALERWWLARKACHVRAFIVQTPSMKEQLTSSGLADNIPVYVMPFINNGDGYQRSLEVPMHHARSRYDFLYVASGEPHKNHRRLVEAWCLLASEGIFPSLRLTLDKNASRDLCDWIEEQSNRYGLRIENLGLLLHEQIKLHYKQARALIFPSTFESFGLPLIEARQSGLPVLAAELDYVRDVLDPEQSFDPQSPASIARAVKRFLGHPEAPLPLMDATEFVRNILEKFE